LTLAVVTAALAPLYGAPDLRSELVSQAPLGHLLAVREERGPFVRVRIDDGYPGWVHAGYVGRGDDDLLQAWREEAGLASLGATLSLGGRERLLLPLGARLATAPGGAVRVPDGRVAQVAAGRVAPLAALREEARAMSPAAWAAIFFAGAPYLHGGVTPWGVDCSGLVQVTWQLRGVTLPRDSALQADAGAAIATTDALYDFAAGDLLFFSDQPDTDAERRINHVAIADGEGGVVHAALAAGGVARSPLSGNSAEAAALRRTFVRARRPEGAA
jgi:hypothetical protein